MAEENGANGAGEAPVGADSLPQVGVIAQYVKDLSFENPNSPAVFQWQGQPQVDIQVGVAAHNLGEGVYEVTLKIDVNSKTDGGTVFSIDLLYGGLFAAKNVPEDQLQPFLLAEGPRIIFPFARQVIIDATMQGGFPPLPLDPIDFAGLYMQNAAQQQAGLTGGQVGEVTGQA